MNISNNYLSIIYIHQTTIQQQPRMTLSNPGHSNYEM